MTDGEWPRLVCPSCRAPALAGDLVLGADQDGLYIEHLPCSYRGRANMPVLAVEIPDDPQVP